jgi:hypothetical protein
MVILLLPPILAFVLSNKQPSLLKKLLNNMILNIIFIIKTALKLLKRLPLDYTEKAHQQTLI